VRSQDPHRAVPGGTSPVEVYLFAVMV